MKTSAALTIRPYDAACRAIITRWIMQSYWGGWQNALQIRFALQHSLTFVAHAEDGPVGFIRIVTDYATFSAITDLWVEPEHRRQGVGRALMEHVLRDTGVPETICILTTREAGEFYKKFSFVSIGGNVMKRDPSR
jgi:ribosomal protein S18 acetylase RimI-like enzyme